MNHNNNGDKYLSDMELRVNDALGYRSPSTGFQHAGSTPPGQGRSVREVEEQMASLRKENFNLKLRIYFLEEKIPGYKSLNADENESLLKQYVDLKVDVEVLRTELQEKQALLCEAAKAMELMEEQQKTSEEKHKEIIDELNEKIHFMEMENKDLEQPVEQNQMNEITASFGFLGDIDAFQRVRELEASLQQFKDQSEELGVQVEDLRKSVEQKNEKIKELEEKEKQLLNENAELQKEFDNKTKELVNVECTKLREELLECKKQLADTMCELEQAAISLKEKTNSNSNACKLIHNLYLEKEQLDKQIQLLTTKDSLEETGTAVRRTVSDATGTAAEIKMRLEKVIAEKNTEINTLKSDVKRNKKYLRTLINKELVQKTIEIGSLSQLYKRLQSEPLSPSLSVDENVEDLGDSFTEAKYTECLERNQNLQKKLNTIIQRLFTLNIPANDALVNQLRLENSDAREEVEQAHEYRREACRILTERLEELASFLESMLQHESVYKSLGADKKREIRKAIDSSLNLSRNMNTSLSSVGLMSVTDQSLPQLSNISGLLNASAEETRNVSGRLFKKTEKENTDIIEALKKENNMLKKELSKKRITSCQRKDRSSLPITLDNRNQQDRAGSEESESWSEPDRSVSLARIGLENSAALKCNQHSLRSKSSTSLASDFDNNIKQNKIEQLEKMISHYNNNLLKLQCELVEADNRLKEKVNENNKINQELAECKLMKQSFETQLEGYKSKVNELNQMILFNQESINQIIEEKNSVIKEMQDKLIAETKCNNMKLETLINDNVHLKDTVKSHLEKNIEHERIKKEITDELKVVHKQLHEAENTIDYLRENEAETNKLLIEKEKSLRKLEKNLDDSNLVASKMVVERAKFLQEKKKVEDQLQEATAKLKAYEQEKIKFNERIQDLQNINYNLQSKLLKKIKKSEKESDASGYTSEDLPHRAQGISQRLDSSSPDLGIESDAGRASSEEVAGLQNRLLKSIENFCADENVMGEEKLNLHGKMNDESRQDASGKRAVTPKHDCTKVDQEIMELRRKLAHSQKTLQQAMIKIKSSNQLKEKVERNIRREIVKTENVLKNVRTNLESEAK